MASSYQDWPKGRTQKKKIKPLHNYMKLTSHQWYEVICELAHQLKQKQSYAYVNLNDCWYVISASGFFLSMRYKIKIRKYSTPQHTKKTLLRKRILARF